MEGFINHFAGNFGIADILLLCVTAAIMAALYLGRRFLALKTDNGKRAGFPGLLFRNFSTPVQVLFILTAMYVVLTSLPFQLQEQQWFGKLYQVVIISLFGWGVLRALNMASELFLKRFDTKKKDNLQARQIHTQVKVVKRLVSAVIVLLTFSMALMTSDEIRALGVSLLASAGIAGMVIGLAAQKTIGNFFTGLQIAITQPIRLEDAVVVEGEWGWIEEINLTYVVVKIWDQRRLVLPISYFVDHPFQNWTRTTADLLGTIELHLDYQTPLEPLRRELTRVLENEGADLWDGRVNVIQITDTTERTMTVRALVSAADSPSAWDLRCLCREKLISFIQSEYPQSLPHIRTDIAGLEG